MFDPIHWQFWGLSSDANRAERGRYGEWLSRRFLKGKGYYVLIANWRNPMDRRDEIDLICKDKEVLVFVEVRARSTSSLVSGYDSLSPRKRRVLLRACKSYLNQRKQRPEHFRLDVMEVDLPVGTKGKPEIFHHENIALFPPRFH
ncbi:MAG: YraN family protein [Opitutae bacterium]|nr:YraN family protein [Opitutae bacterium]